jgi:ATP-dependent DNA ligase
MGRGPRPRVRLLSRSGRDHTRRFHDIATAVSKLPARSLVLDGEVAIFDQQLLSRFEWLREPDPDAVATPPMFIAFDLLHRDGRDVIGRPLHERRARLEQVVAGSDFVLSVRRLARNGFEAWSEVIAHDFEGLVAKDETSVRPTARSTTTHRRRRRRASMLNERRSRSRRSTSGGRVCRRRWACRRSRITSMSACLAKLSFSVAYMRGSRRAMMNRTPTGRGSH